MVVIGNLLLSTILPMAIGQVCHRRTVTTTKMASRRALCLGCALVRCDTQVLSDHPFWPHQQWTAFVYHLLVVLRPVFWFGSRFILLRHLRQLCSDSSTSAGRDFAVIITVDVALQLLLMFLIIFIGLILHLSRVDVSTVLFNSHHRSLALGLYCCVQMQFQS